MKITEALLGEHGAFYAQFDYLEGVLSTASLGEAKAMGLLLESGLKDHANLEDDVLFAAVEARLGEGAGPTGPMRDEHDEIRETLSRLPTVDDVDEARDILLHAIYTARDHFRKEEQMLFPLAENELSLSTLNELGEQWAEVRRVMVP